MYDIQQDIQTKLEVIRTNQIIEQAEGASEDTVKQPKLEELQQIINQLYPKKAPGADLIKNKSIQQISENATIKLLYIYIACISFPYLPRLSSDA